MPSLTKNKKGNIAAGVFSGMNGLFVALAAIVIIIAVTFLIIANVLTQIATTEGIIDPTNAAQRTIAYNATLELQAATATIPGWVPLIVITVIGALILLLVKIFNK